MTVVDTARAVTISNVICNADQPIIIAEYLKDSVITNGINKNPHVDPIKVCKADGLDNVSLQNVITLTLMTV